MSNIVSYFNNDKVQERFKKMLGDKSQQFITSVLQCVMSNELLKDATHESIYNAAATAAAMDLPINNNLGFAYIVPYKDKGQQVAQFQMGYKGFIQLAQRTGLYQRISVAVVYEGQLISNNPLEGCVFDWDNKKSEKAEGYVAYFRLLNGFESTLFMSEEEMQSHAKKYSKSYNYPTSVWKKNPIEMAKKTVIKLLLSKFGPLSIEMQNAIISDQAQINNPNTIDVSYIDNDSNSNTPVIENKEKERILELINDCESSAQLDKVVAQIPNPNMFLAKIEAKKTQIEIKNTKGKPND